MSVIPQHTLDDIAQVNASGLTPVVFIHGLWLLPSSWDRWAEVFAGKTVGQVADHYAGTGPSR